MDSDEEFRFREPGIPAWRRARIVDEPFDLDGVDPDGSDAAAPLSALPPPPAPAQRKRVRVDSLNDSSDDGSSATGPSRTRLDGETVAPDLSLNEAEILDGLGDLDDGDAGDAEATAARAEKLEALRKAVHYATGNVALREESQMDARIPKPFIAAVSQVVFAQLELWARDVHAFAKHRSRTTISADDVKLLARRNDHLTGALATFAADRTATAAAAAAAAKSAGPFEASKRGKTHPGKVRGKRNAAPAAAAALSTIPAIKPIESSSSDDDDFL
ncbi:hypothetical protein H9P43_000086 [Blastocladiella emersonii ATCC 22665]|nr:hypothetical protein H9P43_000086 [Blastocladiella emersonii ATCC 22665]